MKNIKKNIIFICLAFLTYGCNETKFQDEKNSKIEISERKYVKECDKNKARIKLLNQSNKSLQKENESLVANIEELDLKNINNIENIDNNNNYKDLAKEISFLSLKIDMSELKIKLKNQSTENYSSITESITESITDLKENIKDWNEQLIVLNKEKVKSEITLDEKLNKDTKKDKNKNIDIAKEETSKNILELYSTTNTSSSKSVPIYKIKSIDTDNNIVMTKTNKEGYQNLMWQEESINRLVTIDKAKNYCKKADNGGYEDWKVPNAWELRTLLVKNKKIDKEFIGGEEEFFWTRTESNYTNKLYFAIKADNGYGEYKVGKEKRARVRCVRAEIIHVIIKTFK